MSAIGTKQTSNSCRSMSAIEGKADMPFALHMSANDPKRTFCASWSLFYVFHSRA
jgi:hypothetical protein